MIGPFWCQSRKAWFVVLQDKTGIRIALNPIQNNQPSAWQQDTQSNHWLVGADGVNKLFYLNQGTIYALTLRKLDNSLMVETFDEEHRIETASPFFKIFAKDKDALFLLNEDKVTLKALHLHFLHLLSNIEPLETPECAPPAAPKKQQLDQPITIAAKQAQPNDKLAEETQWKQWCGLKIRDNLALVLNGILGDDTEKVYDSFRVILDGVFNIDRLRTMDSYRQALEHALTDFKNQNYIAINSICMQTRINKELNMGQHHSPDYLAAQKRLYVFTLLKAELDQLLTHYGLPLKPIQTVLEKPDPNLAKKLDAHLGEEQKTSHARPPSNEDLDRQLAMQLSEDVLPPRPAHVNQLIPTPAFDLNLLRALDLMRAVNEEEDNALRAALDASLEVPSANNAPPNNEPSSYFSLECYMAFTATSSLGLAIGLAILFATAGQVALAVAVPVGVVLVGAVATYGIFKCHHSASEAEAPLNLTPDSP